MLNLQEVEPYELTSFVKEFIDNTFIPEKANHVYNILDILNILNDVPDLDIDYNITTLENKIEDYITSHDHLSTSDLSSIVELAFKDSFSKYLSAVGIYVEQDNYFYVFEQLIAAVLELFTIRGKDVTKPLDILRSDLEDVEIFATLLSNYTNIAYTELYEIITDINPHLISDLIEIYEKSTLVDNPELSKELSNLLNTLLSIDINYMYTFIVKSVLETEFEIKELKANLKDLFNNIDKHNNNMQLIPYEIVATVYLSSDTKDDLTEAYQSINLDTIIGSDQAKADVLHYTVKELIAKLQPKQGALS